MVYIPQLHILPHNQQNFDIFSFGLLQAKTTQKDKTRMQLYARNVSCVWNVAWLHRCVRQTT